MHSVFRDNWCQFNLNSHKWKRPTHILLHEADGASRKCNWIMFRSVDNYIVVIAILLTTNIDCDCLWIAANTGKSLRYINAATIPCRFVYNECQALRDFHALTVCDTTSCFAGRGKRMAWSWWSTFCDVALHRADLQVLRPQLMLNVLPMRSSSTFAKLCTRLTYEANQ